MNYYDPDKDPSWGESIISWLILIVIMIVLWVSFPGESRGQERIIVPGTEELDKSIKDILVGVWLEEYGGRKAYVMYFSDHTFKQIEKGVGVIEGSWEVLNAYIYYDDGISGDSMRVINISDCSGLFQWDDGMICSSKRVE